MVACRPLGLPIMVLAVANYGFVGWPLQVHDETPAGARISFVPCRHLEVQFFHVVNLQDWLCIPIQPRLHGDTGPLILVQYEEPLSLPLARVQEGIRLTVEQAKNLIPLLGGNPQQARGRSALHELLFDMLLEGDQEKELARKKNESATT